MIVGHYEAQKFSINKTEIIQCLMRMYKISCRVAEDVMRDNDWDLMMAAGDIRDELNAEV